MFSPEDALNVLLRSVGPWLLVIAVIAILSYIFSGKKRRGYRYELKDCIMTKAEHACFNALATATQGKYMVFPQVHWDALLKHRIVGQNWSGAFRHINEESVDFVLCEPASLKPVLVVERDDPTHERPDRQARDEEEERIFTEAGLPLIRMRGHDAEDAQLLAHLIAEKLSPIP